MARLLIFLLPGLTLKGQASLIIIFKTDLHGINNFQKSKYWQKVLEFFLNSSS